MKKMILFALFLAFIQSEDGLAAAGPSKISGKASSSKGYEITCIGSADAKNAMVYLHGMDYPDFSDQELDNRAVLEKLAQELDLVIALPRADTPCPSDSEKVCWGWGFSDADIKGIVPRILKSRLKCFPQGRPFGVVGFSNGGFLTNHWFMSPEFTRLAPAPRWMIAVGSARGYLPQNSRKSFAKSSLTWVIGRNDKLNFDLKMELFEQLRQAQGDVRIVQFDGGHEVSLESLREALEGRL